MTYTTTLLTKREDCNVLLDIANEEKASLEFRKVSLERHKEISSGSSMSLEAELASTIAQMAACQTIINSLPDGDTKSKEITKLKGLDYRKDILTQRKNRYGIVAVLETEYDISRVINDIAETDGFIAAVTERLNAL